MGQVAVTPHEASGTSGSFRRAFLMSRYRDSCQGGKGVIPVKFIPWRGIYVVAVIREAHGFRGETFPRERHLAILVSKVTN